MLSFYSFYSFRFQKWFEQEEIKKVGSSFRCKKPILNRFDNSSFVLLRLTFNGNPLNLNWECSITPPYRSLSLSLSLSYSHVGAPNTHSQTPNTRTFRLTKCKKSQNANFMVIKGIRARASRRCFSSFEPKISTRKRIRLVCDEISDV